MILVGDAVNELKKLEENSIDLIATDPPFGISFMGKAWDTFKPEYIKEKTKDWKPIDHKLQSARAPAMHAGTYKHTPESNQAFQQFIYEVSVELLRVLKPGAFMFMCMTPRQDSLARAIVGIEDAGFKVGFTSMYWTYATGFPKANHLGKKVKKLEGAYGGFQPKPAVEVILVAQKPMTEKTQVAQALDNGKGVTWLGDCRIPYADDIPKAGNRTATFGTQETTSGGDGSGGFDANPVGRFPANLIISDDVLNDGFSRFFSLDKWVERNLPFLIVPKASKKEKNAGCERLEEKHSASSEFRPNHMEKTLNGDDGNPYGRWKKLKNNHPTVKPIKLMSYLITMGSRAEETVLDPFMGSGTTGVSSKLLNRNFIGIELDKEYAKIAKARIDNTAVQTELDL